MLFRLQLLLKMLLLLKLLLLLELLVPAGRVLLASWLLEGTDGCIVRGVHDLVGVTACLLAAELPVVAVIVSRVLLGALQR